MTTADRIGRLRHAAAMTVNEVRELFPEPEFVEAAGVLEMINQTPGQLHEYSARLKLRLDDAARLKYARDQGIEEGHNQGRLEGELLGRITTLQELLSISGPTRQELLRYDLSQLNDLCQQLQQRMQQRDQ